MAKGWFVLCCVGGLFVLPGWESAARGDPAFLRGDANADGRVSISDALMTRRYLFNMDLQPPCLEAANVDDSDNVDITDVVLTLSGLFLGGIPPALPFPAVGPDPTPAGDGLGCKSYEVEPAPRTDDLIRIGDVFASPGQAVEIPVYLTSSVEVEAVQLVVAYEPAVFTPIGFQFAGTPWGDLLVEFRNLRANPAEGFFVAATVGSLTGLMPPSFDTPYPPIPAGDNVLIFKIRGRVSESALEGTTVLLEPTNGPGGEGVNPPYLIRNEITSRGQARYVSFVPRTLPGQLIIGDITFFTRGDSNSDHRVDIADATYLINSLFLGGEAPRCMDAADADDSGLIDITDVVVILGQLFLGTTPIAQPYPTQGRDTTPDNLLPCR